MSWWRKKNNKDSKNWGKEGKNPRPGSEPPSIQTEKKRGSKDFPYVTDCYHCGKTLFCRFSEKEREEMDDTPTCPSCDLRIREVEAFEKIGGAFERIAIGFQMYAAGEKGWKFGTALKEQMREILKGEEE